MNDLISRQAAIEALLKIDCSDGAGISALKCDVIDDAVTAIETLPTVDVVPVVHGRWIPKFNGSFKGGAYWYECSECRHTVPGGLQSGKIFCENCGADMRGEEWQQRESLT